MGLFNRAFRSIKRNGIIRTIQGMIELVGDYYFEKKYNLETFEKVEVNHLDIPEEIKVHSNPYGPTRSRQFKLLLKSLKLPDGLIFMDIGSGKGKVLILASMFNFERVIGIEISEKLCEIATMNINNFKSKMNQTTEIDIVCSSILDYKLSDRENVFYFYRSFDNYIMSKVIKMIIESYNKNSREIWLIMNNFHLYSDTFKKQNLFNKSLIFTYGPNEFVVYKTEG